MEVLANAMPDKVGANRKPLQKKKEKKSEEGWGVHVTCLTCE